MSDAVFFLDRDKLATWELPNPDLLESSWSPIAIGNESDIYTLVYEAQRAGVIRTRFDPAWEPEVAYVYDSDDDGGAYCWTLTLRAPQMGVLDALRLCSLWREQRKVVCSYETSGRAAVEEILADAVDEANLLYATLLKWFPMRVMQLVTITHKHGEDSALLADKEAVVAYLYDWVSQYWDDEGPDEPLPDDREAAIDAYFMNHNYEDWGGGDIAVPHILDGALIHHTEEGA